MLHPLYMDLFYPGYVFYPEMLLGVFGNFVFRAGVFAHCTWNPELAQQKEIIPRDFTFLLHSLLALVWVYRYTHAVVCMWRSEDNLWQSVLSFQHGRFSLNTSELIGNYISFICLRKPSFGENSNKPSSEVLRVFCLS